MNVQPKGNWQQRGSEVLEGLWSDIEMAVVERRREKL